MAFDSEKASQLAAEKRRAYAAMVALDRRGVPVLLREREEAQRAYDEAKAAEKRFWDDPQEC